MTAKRNRLSDVQRKAIRDWSFSQTPRPQQKAIVAWFQQQYGRTISQSSICDCISSKYEYLDKVDVSVLEGTRPAYRMRNSHWPILEDMLAQWQKELSNQGQRVTGDMLLEKAKELYPQIPEYRDKQPPEFSSGWLSRFKERYLLITPRQSSKTKWKRDETLRRNVPLSPTAIDAAPAPAPAATQTLLPFEAISETEPSGLPSSSLLDNMDPRLEQVSPSRPSHRQPVSEAQHSSTSVPQPSWHPVTGSSGTEDNTEEILSMRILCHVYKDEDIYCLSETSIMWRKAPLLSLQAEEKQNSILQFMMCTNHTGNDRLPLWIIGNTSKARSLNNLNIEALGGHWCSSRMLAQVNEALMREWLLKFYDHIGKDRSILLLLDKTVTSYAKGLDLASPPTNIRIQWLPFSSTMTNNPFQPFDHGIRHGLKMTYRRQWLQYIVKNKRQSADPFATVSLYHAVHWAINAWLSEMSGISIHKCFSKAIGATKNTVCDESAGYTGPSCGALYDEVRRLFVKSQKDASDFEVFMDLSDSTIRRVGLWRPPRLVEEEHENNEPAAMRIPTVEQALQSVQILMCYKEYQKDTTRNDMKVLEQWKRELVATTRAA